jgi:hypothetical protein
MRPPALAAVIERRLLVNYRVDPGVLASCLPQPFRPVLVSGYGVAGICLIRLGRMRPAGLPGAGMRAENAAHRIAACWDGPDGPVTGVYIPRRDTSSRLAAMAGGRLFPGHLHPARFRTRERDGTYQVDVASRDGAVRIGVHAHLADQLPAGSVFGDLRAASEFFRCASAGYAATPAAGVFDGVELETAGWTLQPLRLDRVSSSFFDDPRRFPAGTAVPDSAFLMSGLATVWHPQPELRAPAVPPGSRIVPAVSPAAGGR